MKTLTVQIFITFVLSLSVLSCKKGDLGPQGPQGEQGIQGQEGVSGADGSVILSGITAPDVSLGKNGDYYLNKSSSQLYGPKTSDGWGAPLNLKGSTGSAGSNGNTILSGTIVPASTIGKNGDYYINTGNMFFYGPKTSTGWGTPVNLKGPKGDPGNANVSSKIISATNITWSPTTQFGTNYKTANLSIPEITADIVNNGAVIVYGGFFFNEPWSALPLSYYELGKTVHFSYAIKVGGVTLRTHYSDNAIPLSAGIPFKVVIIKGTAITMAKENSVKLTDYLSVSKFFQLRD